MQDTLLIVVMRNKDEQGAPYSQKPLIPVGAIRYVTTNKNMLQRRILYPNEYNNLFRCYYGNICGFSFMDLFLFQKTF